MPQITTSLQIPNYASTPGSPLKGHIYFNTTSNLFFYYDGTAFQQVGAATATLPTGGTVGQLLGKDSSTNYAVSWKTFASLQTSSASPTATANNTTGVMVGLGSTSWGTAIITPRTTGKVWLTISGWMYNDNAGGGIQVALRYGTGTAPNNGASPSGTQIGGVAYRGTIAGSIQIPYSLSAVITGMTVNTAYWLDLSMAAITTGNAAIGSTSVAATEVP